MSDTAPLLDVAVDAARLAGALLTHRMRDGAERNVSSKSTPTDLVSEADLAAERAIRELLGRRRPDDGVVGEEGGSEGGTSGLSWVVDPLDGTVNYLFGIPQWSISVAVRDRERTLAGAVYDPNRGELFTATSDGPARLAGADGSITVLGSGRGAAAAHGTPGERDDPAKLAGAMIATGFAYDADVRAAQARVLTRLIGRVRDIRRTGSAALPKRRMSRTRGTARASTCAWAARTPAS